MYKSYGLYRFGSQRRGGLVDESKVNNVPGPNVYNPDSSAVQRRLAKWSFGSEQQRPMTQSTSNIVPGPGQYPIKTLVGAEAVSLSMGAKLKNVFDSGDNVNVPGPGTYKIDISPVKTKDP